MSTKDRKLKVFLSYSSKDAKIVEEIKQYVKSISWIDLWVDKDNLILGDDWAFKIERAMETSDAVMLCVSNDLNEKSGYLQKEFKKILSLLDEQPEGSNFVLPVRLENCRVPKSLERWQYVDFFPEKKKQETFARIFKALEIRANQLSINVATAENIALPQIVQPNLFKKLKPVHWSVGAISAGLCILLAIVAMSTLPELLISGFLGIASLFYHPTPTPTYSSIQSPFIENSQPTEQTEVPYDVTIIPETPTSTSEPQSFTVLPGPISEVKWNSFTSEQLTCMSSKYVIPVDGVVSAEFLPGGRALAVQLGSGEPQIGVWKFADNSWVGKIIPGNTLTQTPEGPVYMLAGYEEAEVYSVETGQLVFTAPEPNEDPIGFSASHNGKLFAFGYQSGKIVVYDRVTSKSFTVFSTGLAGSQIVFSQDDRFFATGDRYAPISIWNTETHSLVAKLKTQSSFFSFSRDGQYLIYIGFSLDDSAFYVFAYSLQDQQIKKIIPIEYIWGERDQARTYMSIENDLYGFGGNFWELSTNAPIRLLQEHDPYPAVMVTGSLEGNQLVSIGYDKMIVWDLSCGR